MRVGPPSVRDRDRRVAPAARGDMARCEGDVRVGPYGIEEAVDTIHAKAGQLVSDGTRILALGGDHTIALPLLRAAAAEHGPLAVLHFDAHLDTWDVLHGASIWHGSPFRRAAEEGLLDLDHCQHVGIRGGVYGPEELDDDRRAGFELIRSEEFQNRSMEDIAGRIRRRLGSGPVYVSIDIDVLDPSQAPGTGTPEVAGTGLAAAHTAWELLTLMGLGVPAARR
ncbi:arginase family protein [Agromyces sp. NPDC004153]